jgi:hypothetical protein
MRRRSRDLSDEAAATIGRKPAESRARPSADPLRRLGVSEYVLFGLIALGIAITVVMALLNP